MPHLREGGGMKLPHCCGLLCVLQTGCDTCPGNESLTIEQRERVVA